MSIRDSYIPTFNAIARRHHEEPSTAQIGPGDSLRKTIGYTRQHVIEHDQQHFRYEYYHGALSLALTRLGFDPAHRRVVHLDIGCGPGVFSWVMYDYVASAGNTRPWPVDYYGYDHSPAMIQLAHLFLERFAVQYEFHGFSDLADISIALADRDFSDCDVVVTFGYALVQVRDNPAALGDFATLIAGVFPSHSCIMVAADAHNDRAVRKAFRDQCGALGTALNEVGVALEDRMPTARGSVMCARLKTE